MPGRALRWWLLGAVLLALGLLAVVGSEVGRKHAAWLTRERIETALSEALGRPVRIEQVLVEPWRRRVGLVGVSVGPGPGPDAGPRLTLRRIDATIGLQSLWRRELVLSRVVADEVDLRHDSVSDRPLKLPPSIPDRVDIGPITVVIGAIDVRRATVTYRQPQAGRQVDLQGLTVVARPLGGGLDLTLAAATARVRLPAIDEVIHDVEASGRLRGDRLQVTAASARWRSQTLSVTGEIRTLGERPRVSLRLRGTLPLGPLAERAGLPEPLAGVARVDASLHGPPAAVRVSAEVTVPRLTIGRVEARRVQARVVWEERTLTLRDLTAQALDGRVSGSLTLSSDAPDRARAAFQLTDVSLGSLGPLTGRALGLGGRVRLEGEVDGDLRRPAELRGRVRFEAPNLAPPGALACLGPVAVRGEARLHGSALEIVGAEGRSASARLDVRGRVGLDGTLALRAKASGEVAGVAGALGACRRNRDRGAPRVSRGAAERWGVWGARGSPRGASPPSYRESEPPTFLGYPLGEGQATVAAEIGGRWNDPIVTGRTRAGRVGIHGATFERFELPFVLTPRTLRIEGAEARLGATAVRVGASLAWPGPFLGDPGAWRERLRGSLTLDAPEALLEDLSPWVPPAWRGSGRLGVVARFEGTPAAWRGSALVEAEHLTVRRQTVSALRARVTAGPGGLEAHQLRARVAGVALAGDVTLAWDGTGRGRFQLGPAPVATLPGVRPGYDLEGSARARVDLQWKVGAVAMSGTVTVERLGVLGVGLGRGEAHLGLRDGVLTGEVALPAARIRGTATGRLAEGGAIRLRLEGRDLGLAPLLRRWAPPALAPDLEATASALAEIALPVSDPSAVEGTLRLDPVRLRVAGEEWRAQGPVVVARQRSVNRVERLEIAGRLGSLAATGSVDDRGHLDVTVNARVPLSLLARLRPEIREAAGTVEARVVVGGSLAAPEIAGEGTLAGGRIAFGAWPEAIREIRGRFALSPEGARLVEAVGLLGGGELRASGDLAFEGRRIGPFRVTIAARSVTLAPVRDLTTTWDADLELVGLPPRAEVRGEARLLRGLYAPDLSLLRLFVAQRRPVEAPGAAGLHLDVRVALGDNLAVRTSLARLRAGGILSLQGTTAAPAVFGALEAREGQVVFRRHTFTLTAASARFSDPRRIDPILDVRGTAQIRGYDVRLSVSGRSENLEIRLASSPPLPEEDILSLVVFGATRTELGRSGAGLVAGELAAFIVEDLFGLKAGTVGLDVFEVDRADAGGSTLRVGKRLDPRTVLLYSQGLENAAERKLRIEYQVLGPLRVAGEQDFRGGFGADVLVRVRFR